MITCPACHNQEYEGEFFCSECGARIWGSAEVLPTMKFNSARLREAAPPVIDPVAADSIPAGRIVLSIAGSPTPIALEGKPEYRLGREGQEPHVVDVNLNPYGAREKGVSRLHALLRVDRQQVLLMDLGSANGTLLNGTPLTPNEPVRLESGDEIRLGKLSVKIHFNL